MIEKYSCADFRYIYNFNDNVTCLGRSEHINSVLLNVLSFQLPDLYIDISVYDSRELRTWYQYAMPSNP